MSTSKQYSFSFELIDEASELSPEERALIQRAEEWTDRAYAPYSNFQVGAALALANGEIVAGSNKENASFPAGMCAERNALAAASDAFPGVAVHTIAIAVRSKELTMDEPTAPCGICRQVLCETEQVQNRPIKLLLTSPSGKIMRIDRCLDLLPFHFYLKELKK